MTPAPNPNTPNPNTPNPNAGVPHYLAFRLTVVGVVLAALAAAAFWLLQPGRWESLISLLQTGFQ